MRHKLRLGKEAVFNENVFTQNFFTQDATHKQSCTSFYPEIVITYSIINGKGFLNAERLDAHIL